jgi:ParB family chromosome partitioning protein
MSRVTMLHATTLHPHPANIRHDIGDVTELAASIQAQGLLEPLVVVPHPHKTGHYLVVAGNRRLAACRKARAEIVACIIRRDPLTPADVTALMVVENVHRRDLNPVEKAEALGRLTKTHSAATVAYMTGMSPSAVSYYLSLLNLDAASRERVRAGVVPVGDAIAAVRGTRKRGRPAGSRGPGRPRTVEPRHLTATHPLAGDVRARCTHTTRPKLNKVGCEECWEEAIRADERRAPAGEVAATPVTATAGPVFREPVTTP